MAMDKTRECPDCGAEMIAGSRRDKFTVMNAAPESWVPARPRKDLPLFLMPSDKPVPVVTYACTGCGRLLSYVEPKKD